MNNYKKLFHSARNNPSTPNFKGEKHGNKN